MNGGNLMLDVIEDIRNEFKIKLTDDLEKEVIAFLNTQGGNIFIGVDDTGNVVGLNLDVDLLQRTIKDRIKDNIMPSTIGLYDVAVLDYEDKKYIKIIVARGVERPYYLKGMGMTPESCFMRVGSAVQSMPYDIINNTFVKRVRNSLKKIESPEQDLSFTQLKIYYEEKKIIVNDNFLRQLGFFTDDGLYNMNAFLLSDNNNIPIRFGKYSGTQAIDLIENEDFGCCSIVKATKSMLEKLKIENKIYTKVGYPQRKEIEMFDFDAVREAVINAIVHNDWANGYAPKVEMFSDRLAVSSNGGIQDNVTEEDFLKGFSLPKNPELMKVFRDLELVEQMGTGIIRILKSYSKQSFEFFPNFIRVSFPFKKNKFDESKKMEFKDKVNLSITQQAIVKLMSDNPRITQKELARLLDITVRAIQKNIKSLIDLGVIQRWGSDRKGKWKINSNNL